MRTPHKHAEVIKAWADGGVIERRCPGFDWEPCNAPIWELDNEYRVKPAEFPPLPEGWTWHNPFDWTPEQFGVEDGWRPAVREVECTGGVKDGWQWTWDDGDWSETAKWVIHKNEKTQAYRTKAPLPVKPKLKRVPLSKEDFDGMPVIWIKGKNFKGLLMETLVTQVGETHLYSQISECDYKSLMTRGEEYSTDRKEWHPCWKEVEE